MFKTVRRDFTLSERTSQQIEELILNRSLSPGDRLPSQEELTRHLGVSRTVIREAVQLLAAKGLLDARKGSGIFVRAVNSDVVRDSIGLLARSQVVTREGVMEVREFLEPKIAELAATRAQSSDIAILEETVRKMNGRLSPHEFAVTDLAFHNQLANASGNPLLHAMAVSINHVLINVYHLAADLYGTEWNCEQTFYHHSRILEQLKARNPEGALTAMKDHMDLSRKVLAGIDANLDGKPAPDIPLTRRSRVGN
jgi:DNA-binding FadR family transcriptional regulator